MLITMLPLLLLLCAQAAAAASNLVKITGLPFKVNHAHELSRVSWFDTGDASQETLYCVGDSTMRDLRFMCVDCAEKDVSDLPLLLNAAGDISGAVGFPALLLKNIRPMRHWNGLTISCQATTAVGSTVFVSSSVIDVRYLSNVRITDAGGDSPALVQQESYAFFVEPSGPAGCTKTLSCAVEANPMPSSYKWIVGGTREVGQSREVTLGSDFVGQSVQCAARISPSETFVYSLPVQFQKYVEPRVASIAFADFRSSSQVHEGDVVAMSCRFSGVPKPTVAWHYRYSYGELSDAKCESEDEESVGGGGLFEYKNYTSTCRVTMKNAAYSGQYWCSVCSHLSNSTRHCANDDGREVLSIKVLPRSAYQRPGHNAVSDHAGTTFELSTILPIVCVAAAVLLIVLLLAYALFCRHKPVQPTRTVDQAYGLVNSGLLPSSKSSQCSNSPVASRSPGNDSYDDSAESRYATADEIKAFLRGDFKRSTTSVRPALHPTESRKSIMV